MTLIKKRVLIAHPGTQYAFRLVAQLHKHEMLYSFYTCAAFGVGSFWFRLLNRLTSNRLENRFVHGVPNQLIHTFFWLELLAFLEKKIGKRNEEIFGKRNKKFQQKIPDHALESVDIVIGFDTSSVYLARRCKELGKFFILDQSIAHPVLKETIFKNVRLSFPEWSSELIKKDQSLINDEMTEYRLAARICVASTFTATSLTSNGVDLNKVSLNPYGVDSLEFFSNRTETNNLIRFIFVGSVSARKGVPVLMEAWRMISTQQAELLIVGPISDEIREKLSSISNVRVLGRVNHKQTGPLYANSDVFVFPSYFEGFGLVLLEAMSSGLPVITTEATAGPDIITNGVEGYLMESGDSARLAKLMKRFIDDRSLAITMGRRAQERAAMFSWDAYGERWKKLLNSL